jgi:hypothetical protein
MANNPHQNLQGPLADNNNTNFMGSGVPPDNSGQLSFQFQEGQVSAFIRCVPYVCSMWKRIRVKRVEVAKGGDVVRSSRSTRTEKRVVSAPFFNHIQLLMTTLYPSSLASLLSTIYYIVETDKPDTIRASRLQWSTLSPAWTGCTRSDNVPSSTTPIESACQE